MKKNNSLTGNEVKMTASQRIVSTTDLKGRITYANNDFIQISGYSKEELINHGHNIVRHPTMPKLAFNDLWKTIQAGKPWMGIVNNRCKNGDNYWVDAYITPVLEGHKVIGYQSVRVKPDQHLVERAEQMYDKVTTGFSFVDKLKKALDFNLAGRQIFASFIVFILGSCGISLFTDAMSLSLAIILFFMFGLLMLAANLIASPYRQAAEKTKAIFANDIAQQIYSGRNDELGQLQLVIKMLKSQQDTVIWRTSDATGNLSNVAASAAAATEQTSAMMKQQTLEVEQVATAINEMSATVKEVAENAAQSAEATRIADEEVIGGQQVVEQTTSQINQLAQEVEQAVAVINTLAEDSQQIGSVVDVIRGIAEQTNLLALNAAIEAARAGEQGRGFAVVADEVRTLAGRTQTSTEEIQDMVSRLQHSASNAVSVMKQGQELASTGAEQAQQAGASLQRILDAVNAITDMSAQIATAAEEQSAVTEEINKNIVNIDTASSETMVASEVSKEANENLAKSIEELNTMARQFGESALH